MVRAVLDTTPEPAKFLFLTATNPANILLVHHYPATTINNCVGFFVCCKVESVITLYCTALHANLCINYSTVQIKLIRQAGIFTNIFSVI